VAPYEREALIEILDSDGRLAPSTRSCSNSPIRESRASRLSKYKTLWRPPLRVCRAGIVVGRSKKNEASDFEIRKCSSARLVLNWGMHVSRQADLIFTSMDTKLVHSLSFELPSVPAMRLCPVSGDVKLSLSSTLSFPTRHDCAGRQNLMVLDLQSVSTQLPGVPTEVDRAPHLKIVQNGEVGWFSSPEGC
jgi:hypothetical protein